MCYLLLAPERQNVVLVLSCPQVRHLLAERKAIYERLNPETKNGAPAGNKRASKKQERQNVDPVFEVSNISKSFTADTAKSSPQLADLKNRGCYRPASVEFVAPARFEEAVFLDIRNK